jgi:hypothetical protein
VNRTGERWRVRKAADLTQRRSALRLLWGVHSQMPDVPKMEIMATVGRGFQARCGAQSPGLPAKVMPGKWVPT